MNGIEYSAGLICDKISRKMPNATVTYAIEDGETLFFKTIINLNAEKYYYAARLPIMPVVTNHNKIVDEIVHRILTTYPNLL